MNTCERDGQAPTPPAGRSGEPASTKQRFRGTMKCSGTQAQATVVIKQLRAVLEDIETRKAAS